MNILSGIDGVDHINIYSKGNTELGRWLSNFTYSPIELEDDGSFVSIEGYWYWLSRSRDDRFRTLVGYAAKSLGRTMRKVGVDGFEEKILKAIDVKLKSNREMMTVMAKSELPFTHYYEFSGVRRDAGYEWIVEHFEHRRTILKDKGWHLK